MSTGSLGSCNFSQTLICDIFDRDFTLPTYLLAIKGCKRQFELRIVDVYRIVSFYMGCKSL